MFAGWIRFRASLMAMRRTSWIDQRINDGVAVLLCLRWFGAAVFFGGGSRSSAFSFGGMLCCGEGTQVECVGATLRTSIILSLGHKQNEWVNSRRFFVLTVFVNRSVLLTFSIMRLKE